MIQYIIRTLSTLDLTERETNNHEKNIRRNHNYDSVRIFKKSTGEVLAWYFS